MPLKESSFLISYRPEACSFIKKREFGTGVTSSRQVPLNFTSFKKTFFIEHLWATAPLVFSLYKRWVTESSFDLNKMSTKLNENSPKELMIPYTLIAWDQSLEWMRNHKQNCFFIVNMKSVLLALHKIT